MLHSYKGNLVPTVYGKGKILQKLKSLGGVVQLFYPQHVISDVPIWLKVHVGELTASNRQFLQSQLVVNLFTASGLTAFCSIGSKPKDKFLQILHLFFTFLGLILCLALHNLAHLVPEVVVSTEKGDFSVVNVADVGTN